MCKELQALFTTGSSAAEFFIPTVNGFTPSVNSFTSRVNILIPTVNSENEGVDLYWKRVQ